MSEESIYLVELQDSTGEIHGFCTGTGYMSLPFDYGQLNAVPPIAVSNVFYSPRVEQPGLFRQNMFDVGTTGGHSSGGYGEIILINTDGGLDSLVDLGFDGQLCIVKEGAPGLALSQFSTVITGTVEQCELSWSRITLRLKDKTSLLDTPVQSTLYLGNNALPEGIEGVAELKDKPKPRLFGVCNNITPICVNTAKLVYQVNSGPVGNIVAVHDGGNVGQILQGPDYATSAELLAAYGAYDPASPRLSTSTYSTCLAEGLFRLDQPAFLQVTCDVIQGATVADRYASTIIGNLAAEKVGAGSIVVQSLIELAKAAPYEIGYYSGGNAVTTAAILDGLCASVGAWWGFDNLGMFWCKLLQAPVTSQAAMTLTPIEILSIDRTATADGDKGVPAWRVNVDFSRNWTVQTSGLAGSASGNQLSFAPDDASQLTQDRKNLLAMEYLRTKAEDPAVKTTHVLAPEINITTTLNSLANANAVAARSLALRKVRRDRLAVKLSAQAIQCPIGGYWDDEAISELPFYRTQQSSVVFGNYVYIVGGVDYNGVLTASVLRLDLSNPTGAWDDAGVTNLPTPRWYHSCVVYGNYLYVVGGSYTNPSSTGTASVIRLDLTNPAGAWEDVTVTDLPAARRAHSCAVYGSYLYVVGGYVTGAASASTIRLNLATPAGAWDDAGVTNLPATRAYHFGAVYGTYLYIIGGRVAGTSSASVIRLNLTTPAGAWDDAGVTDLPLARSNHDCLMVDQYLCVIGGDEGAGGNLVSSVTRLDLNNPAGAWDDAGISDLPVVRMSHSSIYFAGNLYVIGGLVPGGNNGNTLMWRSGKNPADRSQLTSLGRTVLVKCPRYGYADGRPMKIIGAESDLKNRIITLDLWG